MARRGIFDHPIIRRSGMIGAGEVPAGFVKAPFASGRYYPESFSYKVGASEKNLGGTLSVTNIGPFFVGGERTFDRIGMMVRHSSAPGTSPDYRFVIYQLDSFTFLPTALLYEGADRQPTSTASTWEEDTISLTVNAAWVGIGWHWNHLSVGSETIAVRAHGETPIALNSLGYAPYGHSRVTTTLTMNPSIYATQPSDTPDAAGPGDFTTAVPAGVVNPYLGSGAYLRVA